jgi:hypothetical protein
MQMQKVLLTIDKLSTFVGHTFSWLIISLTFMITWEVVSRYAFDNPHPWAFDVMIMMYGSLFMMAGAYTLSKNGHVRGDVLYGFLFSARPGQPGPAALLPVLHSRCFCAGLGGLQLRRRFLGHQRAFQRHRRRPAGLSVQDGAAAGRCLPAAAGRGGNRALRDLHPRSWEWPSREHDVEEVDVEKLKEMVHVRDEDIAALDKFVVAQEHEHQVHEGAAK